MHYVNIHDAKTNLSKYIEEVSQYNDKIIICKNGKPMAELSAYQKKSPRQFGLLKGKIHMHADFDELPDEFMEYFQ